MDRVEARPTSVAYFKTDSALNVDVDTQPGARVIVTVNGKSTELIAE